MTVEVMQADREAAADFICWQRAATQSAIEGQHDVRQFFVAGFSKAIRQGIWDEHQVVQAFAAHRTTALEGVAGLVEALGPFLFVAKSIPERMHDGRYVEAKIDLLPGELDKLPKIGGETVQSASLNISLDGLNVGHFRALTAAPAVPQDVGGISDRLKRIQRDMLETVSGSTGWIDGSEARAFVQRIEAELQQLAALSQHPSPVAVEHLDICSGQVGPVEECPVCAIPPEGADDTAQELLAAEREQDTWRNTDHLPTVPEDTALRSIKAALARNDRDAILAEAFREAAAVLQKLEPPRRRWINRDVAANAILALAAPLQNGEG